jgi:hypothetical protein
LHNKHLARFSQGVVFLAKMATAAERQRPNVLITGTPGLEFVNLKFSLKKSWFIGTGKSTLAIQLTAECNMRHLNVSEIVKQNKFYEEYDENNECHVLDEDALLDFLEVGFIVNVNT